MDISATRVATAPRASYEGEGFRQVAPQYDPLSGEGARIAGGRFNPVDSFPALYLCITRACAVAELQRRGNRELIGVEGLLPRALYRYDIALESVLDLRHPRTLEHLGITTAQLVGADLSITRQIGEAAHSTGIQAIRSPSAAGVDDVLAVFPQLLGSGLRVAALIETWGATKDLE